MAKSSPIIKNKNIPFGNMGKHSSEISDIQEKINSKNLPENVKE
jgi:hypothetical protein